MVFERAWSVIFTPALTPGNDSERLVLLAKDAMTAVDNAEEIVERLVPDKSFNLEEVAPIYETATRKPLWVCLPQPIPAPEVEVPPPPRKQQPGIPAPPPPAMPEPSLGDGLVRLADGSLGITSTKLKELFPHGVNGAPQPQQLASSGELGGLISGVTVAGEDEIAGPEGAMG